MSLATPVNTGGPGLSLHRTSVVLTLALTVVAADALARPLEGLVSLALLGMVLLVVLVLPQRRVSADAVLGPVSPTDGIERTGLAGMDATHALDAIAFVALARLAAFACGSWDWPWELGLVAAMIPPSLAIAAWSRSNGGLLWAEVREGNALPLCAIALGCGIVAGLVLHWLPGDDASIGTLIANASTGRIVWSCLIGVLASAFDEVLYRFVLPFGMRPLLRRWTTPLISIAYGVGFCGWWSVSAGLAATAIGLVLGLWRERGLPLAGAVAGHAALTVTLVLLG